MSDLLMLVIAYMIWLIGYGLSVAAVLALNRAANLVTPRWDFLFCAFWPVLAPPIIFLASIHRDSK